MSEEAKRLEMFTRSYNEYFPLIYGSVYSRIGKTQETEDVCQEIFVRFFRKLDEIENHRKWLYGTIRYVLLEHFKAKSSPYTETDIDGVQASYVNGFRDTRIILEQAMEELEEGGDEGLRTVFDYVAVNNFTYRDAGVHLGLTEQQVRYRYEKALKRLTDSLKKRGIMSLEDLL